MKKQYAEGEIYTTQVTKIGKWFHCRIWHRNLTTSEEVIIMETKTDIKANISKVFQEDFRVLDKSGLFIGDSKLAHASRHRNKEVSASEEIRTAKNEAVIVLGRSLKPT